MSFETARSVTPESTSQHIRFTRRPEVRFPVEGDVRQSVNISQDTMARAAMRNMVNPHAPNQSYSPKGKFSSNLKVGQFLTAFA